MTDILSLFYFNGNDVEDITMYKPGGFHPVRLGDTFSTIAESGAPRYRVLHKLGHGSFSTVWLAEDAATNHCVALKIALASQTGVSNERTVLEWLREHSGGEHIVRVHDAFEVCGPNGTHPVLVTDVVASLYALRLLNVLQNCARDVCRQVVSAVAFLQQHGVTHGDLHFGNIGCVIPEFDELSVEKVLRMTGDPEITAVVPRDPAMQSEHLPRYLVSSISIGEYLGRLFEKTASQLLQIRIMDFGNAFLEQDPRPALTTPMFICAPELIFHRLSSGELETVWGPHSDIWSLACTIYEIVSGFVMFSKGAGHEDRLIYEAIKLVGPLPARWVPYWDSTPFQDGNEKLVVDPDAEWLRRRESLRGSAVGDERDDSVDRLVSLLRSMLRWEPGSRPDAAGLLGHSWFTK